ncbi:hypothetical protein [Pseudomonas sp. R4-35-07]
MPGQCVFVSTTNHGGYLKDTIGGMCVRRQSGLACSRRCQVAGNIGVRP